MELDLGGLFHLYLVRHRPDRVCLVHRQGADIGFDAGLRLVCAPELKRELRPVRAHLAGERLRPIIVAVVLVKAAQPRTVVPARLQDPDLVAPGAPYARGIERRAQIDDELFALPGADEMAQIVVIVAFVVEAALRRRSQPVLPVADVEQLRVGQPVVLRKGRGPGRFLRLLRAENALEQAEDSVEIAACCLVCVVMRHGERGQPVGARALSEAVEERAVGGDGIAVVGEVDVFRAAHIGLDDVFAAAADQRLIKEVEPPVREEIELLHAVEQHAARQEPVAGALVAAAVRLALLDIDIQLLHRPRDVFRAQLRVLHDDECQRHDVAQNPRIPVVDLVAVPAEPGQIVVRHEGRHDAPVQLQLDAPAYQRRFLIEPPAQEIVGPGQHRGGVGGGQIDEIDVGDVGQGVFDHAAPHVIVHVVVVMRIDPRALLADGPDQIDDLVDIPSLTFDAFGQHADKQHLAALARDCLMPGRKAGAVKVHIIGGGQVGNLKGENLLAQIQIEIADGGRELLPDRAFLIFRKGMELFPLQELFTNLCDG